MRRSFSMLVAAAIAITGAATSFAPAQAAALRAAPAVVDQSAATAGIVEVHRRHYRRGHHYSYYKPYYKHRRYVKRRHYPYAYYPYHRRHYSPGFSIQFGFGGPSYGYGYRHW